MCPEHHRKKSASNGIPDGRLDLRQGGLAEVWKTVKSLVTNVPYVLVVLYGTFDALITNGFVAFGPKYVQQQFGLSATLAGIVFGQLFAKDVVSCAAKYDKINAAIT